jgi:hypothetical protein
MLIVVSWRDRRNHPLLFLAKSLQPYVAILGEIAATIHCYSWRDRRNHLLLFLARSPQPSVAHRTIVVPIRLLAGRRAINQQH